MRQTTDANGLLRYGVSYDPYGNPIEQIVNPVGFGYTGAQTDENGLIYLRARYYDPRTSSFLSKDPVHGMVGGASVRWNPYSYVGGNPVNRVDPSGRCFACVVIGAAVIGGILFGGYEAYQQHQQYGEINDWGAVRFSAAKGAVVGGLLGFTYGLVSAELVVGSNAAFWTGATTNIAGSIIAGNYDPIEGETNLQYAGRIAANGLIDTAVGGFGGLLFYGLIPTPLSSLGSGESIAYKIIKRAAGAGLANAGQGVLNNVIRGHFAGQEEYRYKSFGDFARRSMVDFQWGWLVSGFADSFAMGVGRFNIDSISITKLRRMKYKGDFIIPTNVNFQANSELLSGIQKMWGTYSALNKYSPLVATTATTNSIVPILDPWITLFGEQ